MHAVEHHKDKAFDKVEHHHEGGKHIHNHHDEFAVVYSDDIEDKIDLIIGRLEVKYPDMKNYRWHAIKFLERDDEIINLYPLGLDDIVDKNYETEIIKQKYDFIEEVISEVLVNKDAKSAATDKIDSFFTHEFWGIPIFLGIMAIVFFFTFTVGDYLKGYIEEGLTVFSDLVLNLLQILFALLLSTELFLASEELLLFCRIFLYCFSLWLFLRTADICLESLMLWMVLWVK